MAKKTKFFRVATEGATTDGRTITRQMIQEMAATYDTNKYGARINLEHIRGIVPDGPFKAYGDVIALKTDTNAEGKLQLLAQLDPTDALVAMTTKDRQKVYSSIEVDPDFANSGQAYMVALAVTDNPASLGTEMLAFSATATNSPLAGRKQRPENLFTAAEQALIEFEDEAGDGGEVTLTLKGSTASLLERFTAGLLGKKPSPTTPPENKPATSEQPQQFTAEMATNAVGEAVAKAMERFSANMTDAIKPVTEALETLRRDHDALVTKLSDTDGSAPRTAATGGSKFAELTDC
ncbi:GPO family capsid scaffolding protein [Pandoraea terrigena]|uniref:Phage capsid protein n=1 Tax=Pandoraea terrigena TaxID=2508292 RepID=A0A5E4YCP8_9BURK|nr:GPO family capsid scaffolding protein [Pandoraea terrigena]VVE46232.1 hypothetical protein PTE31013_04448 [Pandoraea terrigena]